ncbi:MAG: hypothetical protein QXO51_04530 [Halobacteria archaeon]
MGSSLSAVLRVAALASLLALSALGSVRLLRKGLPFPPEAVAVLAALGFAALYLLRGSSLSRRRGLLLALAGGGAAAYFGAALGGLPALLFDPFESTLFPGWSALLVALAAGAAFGAVLFGPLSPGGRGSAPPSRPQAHPPSPGPEGDGARRRRV